MQIIKVPYVNSIEKNKGCLKSPDLILDSLKEIKCNEKLKPIDTKLLNIDKINFKLENIDEANYLIFRDSKEIIEKNFKTFFLGGDHAVSYNLIKAFFKVQENPLAIIFDSGADAQNIKKKSDEFNNHNWLRKLVWELDCQRNIILVSSRNLGSEEIRFVVENKIVWIKPDVIFDDIQNVCDVLMERARVSGGFYVSIDISSVDPAFGPGCNKQEPGGLSSREIIYFLKRLSLLKNFRGADVCEINPLKDVNNMTVKLGAKLLAEML